MIPRELLLSNGTIDALETVLNDGPRTTGELTESIELSESTVRRRMDEIADAGLVELDAEIRDGQPVRVYRLTDTGYNATHALLELLGEARTADDSRDPTDVSTRDPDPKTDSVSDDSQPSDGDMKPGGVTFGGDDE